MTIISDRAVAKRHKQGGGVVLYDRQKFKFCRQIIRKIVYAVSKYTQAST